MERAYLPYRSAREHEDRGMAKWMGFFLSEHTTSLKDERKREAGVLLATGVPQLKIVLQYIAELVMIAVLSFGASYFTAGLIAQQMGDQVVSQAAQNATRQADSSLNGASLGADADSVTSSRTLEKVTVGVQPTDLLAVWGAGLAVIIIAVLLASRPITQSTPKELLTEVD